MSYLAQRTANAFPIWSNTRMDPSSLGFRTIAALAKGEDEATIDAVRRSILGGILNTGISTLENPEIFSLNYSDETASLAEALLGAGSITEEALWESDGGFRLILPGGTTKYPVDMVGTYLYSDDTESEVSLTRVTDKVDFDFPLPTDYDPVERNTFSAFTIWCSDDSIATTLGTNPDGDYPTLRAPSNRPPYRGYGAIDFQLPVYNDGEYIAHRIGIKIEGSSHYKRFDDNDLNETLFEGSTVDKLDTNIPFLGYHKLILRGLNEIGKEDEEEIYIRDDGCYRTTKTFISIERVDLGGKSRPAVEYDGFNGTVTLQIEDIRHPTKEYPFLPAVSPDNSNAFDENGIPLQADDFLQVSNLKDPKGISFGHLSPLMLELSLPEVEGINGSYLDSYFLLFMNGQSYRRFGTTLGIEDTRELLASQWLLDEEGEAYTAVDFTFNYFDGKTYILDDIGRVHIHKLGLSDFEAWTLPRTKGIDIEINPLSHRAMLGETIPVWTWHRILRRPIKRVAILRESPTAIAATRVALAAGKLNEPSFRGEYLQSDFSWKSVWLGLDGSGNDIWDDTAKYYFIGDAASSPEESWKDKKFYTSFPHDESSLGQWNFYCESVLRGERDIQLDELEALHDTGVIDEDSYWKTKEALLKREDVDTIHRFSTAVFCEYLQAERTLGTAINPLVTSGTLWGIYFEGLSDNLCIVTKASSGQPAYTANKFKLLSHVYLPWQTGTVPPTLLFREDYEKVTFMTPYSSTLIEVEKT